VQQAKHLRYRAEFKDTLQVGQFKKLIDIVCDIHQLKADGTRTGPLPQNEQHSQSTRINPVNLSHIKEHHPGFGLAEYRVTQGRVGATDYHSALTAQHAGVPQLLNRQRQHKHSPFAHCQELRSNLERRNIGRPKTPYLYDERAALRSTGSPYFF
jgi:hypothetical protein